MSTEEPCMHTMDGDDGDANIQAEVKPEVVEEASKHVESSSETPNIQQQDDTPKKQESVVEVKPDEPKPVPSETKIEQAPVTEAVPVEPKPVETEQPNHVETEQPKPVETEQPKHVASKPVETEQPKQKHVEQPKQNPVETETPEEPKPKTKSPTNDSTPLRKSVEKGSPAAANFLSRNKETSSKRALKEENLRMQGYEQRKRSLVAKTLHDRAYLLLGDIDIKDMALADPDGRQFSLTTTFKDMPFYPVATDVKAQHIITCLYAQGFKNWSDKSREHLGLADVNGPHTPGVPSDPSVLTITYTDSTSFKLVVRSLPGPGACVFGEVQIPWSAMSSPSGVCEYTYERSNRAVGTVELKWSWEPEEKFLERKKRSRSPRKLRH